MSIIRAHYILLAFALLTATGCFSTRMAIDSDPEPGLFIKGDVARVKQRKLVDWMLMSQNPSEVLYSAGMGSFWGVKATGDMVMLGGRGYIKTTVAESKNPFNDSVDMIQTPFSFGIARGHERILGKGADSFPTPLTLAQFMEKVSEDSAVLALVEFEQVQGEFHRKAPIVTNDPKDDATSYLEPVDYHDRVVVIFGLSVRDSEQNRQDKALAEILKSVLDVNLEEKPSGKLHTYASALLLKKNPRTWPDAERLARDVADYDYELAFRVDEKSALKRATWQTFWIRHINPPPGRRYMEPKKPREGPIPYIPLPTQRREP